MIINTEVKDFTRNGVPVLDSYGRCKRILVVSYVDKEGKVQLFGYPIPEEMMYQWKYAKKNETPDSMFQSWDFKPVIKEPILGNFSEQRIHEILMDLQRIYPNDPQIPQFYELNIPETTFADIETDVDELGYSKPSDVRTNINTCSFVTGNEACVVGLAYLSDEDIKWIQDEIDKHLEPLGVKYHFTYRYHENEASLLNDIFINFIGPAQCVTGWNWFGYDWPYLVNMAKKFNIDISWLSKTKTWYDYKPMMAKTKEDNVRVPMHKGMYDYMEIYKKWDRSVNPKIQNKLDWVAETVLGIKKVEHKQGFKDLWRENPKLYVFYNAIDSVLVREIDNKIRTSSNFFGLANLMHTPALVAFSSTKSIEIVQAEYLYRENKVFPKVKRDITEKEEKYEGALVFEPEPSMYKGVMCCDYASLYPTTCRQFNISPDTFLFKDKNFVPTENEIKCVSGAVYTNKYKGFIPKILDDFYAKRKQFKKKMTIAQEEGYELEEIIERRKKQMGI